jgi:hypothetical protein
VVGGPRETVAMETFSAAVRRGRDDTLSDAASVIASAALTAAERWLRRDDMIDGEGRKDGWGWDCGVALQMA